MLQSSRVHAELQPKFRPHVRYRRSDRARQERAAERARDLPAAV